MRARTQTFRGWERVTRALESGHGKKGVRNVVSITSETLIGLTQTAQRMT